MNPSSLIHTTRLAARQVANLTALLVLIAGASYSSPAHLPHEPLPGRSTKPR